MKSIFGRLRKKHILLFFVDFLSVNGAFFLSFLMHSEFRVNDGVISMLAARIPYVTVIFVTLFALCHLYNNLFKYMSFYEMFNGIVCSAVGTMLCWGVDVLLGALGNPFGIISMYPSIYFTSFMYICFLAIGFRVIVKAYRSLLVNALRNRRNGNKNVMIIGAGDMASALLYEMNISGYRFGNPVVMVDDSEAKVNMSVRGVPVKGKIEDIPRLVKKYEVNEIIYCIPSAPAERKREILELAMSTGCKLKTTPSLEELDSVKRNFAEKIREVDVLDLLSRPEVELNRDICSYLEGQTVLVTGGGGSIGSELCRQIARYNPERIVIFDIYENNAFTLKAAFDRSYCGAPQIDIRIGSVRDIERLREIFDEFRPSSVFHAAAHKHVPLMEDSPYEAIKNNVLGTYNTAMCANEFGVKNFVLLSTDKAVNPTNVMGATKRVAELTVQHFSRISKGTKFAAVRFGNVLGSNGSVIPIFKEQLMQGGPITVTHPDITRYFMTIPEAAQLVVQAGGLAKGGEIFVLDMGEPVKILDLAENLIRLSGFEPYKDIEIQFTGLRPGEKMYEELSLQEEIDGRKRTANDKIFVTSPLNIDDEKLETGISRIPTLTPEESRAFLKDLVPNYRAKIKG